jgi:hypothetical protein
MTAARLQPLTIEHWQASLFGWLLFLLLNQTHLATLRGRYRRSLRGVKALIWTMRRSGLRRFPRACRMHLVAKMILNPWRAPLAWTLLVLWSLWLHLDYCLP